MNFSQPVIVTVLSAFYQLQSCADRLQMVTRRAIIQMTSGILGFYAAPTRFDERVVTIEGPETIGNELVKVISDQTNDNPNKFFIKTEQGGVLIFRAIATVAVFGEITINYSPPQTFLPSPIELGSEWIVSGEATASLFGIEIKIEVTNTAKVVDIEDVIGPAGTFRDSLEVEQQLQIQLSPALATIPSTSSTMWLAPDVGLVQALNSDNVKFELIDYDITIDGKEVAVHPKEKLAMTWGALKKR